MHPSQPKPRKLVGHRPLPDFADLKRAAMLRSSRRWDYAAAILAACTWWAPLPACAECVADCIRPQDQFYVISVRRLGSTFCQEFDWRYVDCQKLDRGADAAAGRLHPTSIEAFYEADDPAWMTVFYVHGNRVEPGEEIVRTLAVYRALLAQCPHAPPIRLVSFSWPTDQIRGPVRDFQAKALRSDPAGWHLAWILARLGSDLDVTLIGYSYGARVIGGGLHALAGGALCGNVLPVTSTRAPFRVVFIAAAVNHDWFWQGRTHGNALQLVHDLLLINNRCDPAMRLYHLSSRRSNPVALGRYGLSSRAAITESNFRIEQVDACWQVGKHHALKYYLSSSQLMGTVAAHIWSPEPLDAASP